jgi:inner membrane protein
VAFSWWLWLLLGFLLLALELMTPGGFYVFFFGVGAIAVGLLATIGLAGPPPMQWLLFAVISVASLAVFRKPLEEKTRKPQRDVDQIVGETAIALAPIEVSGIGKAELRGATWNALNTGESAIVAGQRCRVERVEGLTLYVRG